MDPNFNNREYATDLLAVSEIDCNHIKFIHLYAERNKCN
jgi:hypothetical protein